MTFPRHKSLNKYSNYVCDAMLLKLTRIITYVLYVELGDLTNTYIITYVCTYVCIFYVCMYIWIMLIIYSNYYQTAIVID